MSSSNSDFQNKGNSANSQRQGKAPIQINTSTNVKLIRTLTQKRQDSESTINSSSDCAVTSIQSNEIIEGRRRSSGISSIGGGSVKRIFAPDTSNNPNGSPPSIAPTLCWKCSKKVYAVEAIFVEGKSMHKTCLKCATCNKSLNTSSFTPAGGEIYCSTHKPKTKDIISPKIPPGSPNKSQQFKFDKYEAPIVASTDLIKTGVHSPQSNNSLLNISSSSSLSSSNDVFKSQPIISQSVVKAMELASPLSKSMTTDDLDSSNRHPISLKTDLQSCNFMDSTDLSLSSIEEIKNAVKSKDRTVNSKDRKETDYDPSSSITIVVKPELDFIKPNPLSLPTPMDIPLSTRDESTKTIPLLAENRSENTSNQYPGKGSSQHPGKGSSQHPGKGSRLQQDKEAMQQDIETVQHPDKDSSQQDKESQDRHVPPTGKSQVSKPTSPLDFGQNFYESVISEANSAKKLTEDAGLDNNRFSILNISPITPIHNPKREHLFIPEEEFNNLERLDPILSDEIETVRLLVTSMSSNLKLLQSLYLNTQIQDMPRIFTQVESLTSEIISTANVVHATISKSFTETDFLLSSIRDMQKLAKDLIKELQSHVENSSSIKKGLANAIKRKTKQLQTSAFTTFEGYRFTARPRMVYIVPGFRYETVSPLFFSNFMTKIDNGLNLDEIGKISIHNSSERYAEARAEFKNQRLEHENIYYRKFFWDQEHYNYYALNQKDNSEFWVISIKKEMPNNQLDINFRIIYRTKNKPDYMTTVSAALLLARKGKTFNSKTIKDKSIFKDAILMGYPELDGFKIKRIENIMICDDILTLDELERQKGLKIGVLFVKPGQTHENEMFGNERGSEPFEKFLDVLGDKIKLEGFSGPFLGGLDNKNNNTGLYSLHTRFQNYEIMFHVSTYLPFYLEDAQQIQRKRHIGNDIVTIVFIDGEEDTGFDPRCIKSQFLHVFVIVKLISHKDFPTYYKVSVISNENVPRFGPDLPDPPLFGNLADLRTFLLAKIINGEYASYKAPKLSKPLVKARNMLFDQIFMNYITAESDTAAGIIGSGISSGNNSTGSLPILESASSSSKIFSSKDEMGTLSKKKSSSMSSLLSRAQSMSTRFNSKNNTVKEAPESLRNAAASESGSSAQVSPTQDSPTRTSKKRTSISGAIRTFSINYSLKRNATTVSPPNSSIENSKNHSNDRIDTTIMSNNRKVIHPEKNE